MSIDNDFKRLIKNLDNMHRKQIPFAASLALNETAKEVQSGIEQQLNKDIDRPTPFTQKAFAIKRATKSKQVASVFIKDIQAKYLRYQIEGGSRKATDSNPILIPRKGYQNKYGNLPRGRLSKLKSQGKLFSNDGIAFQKYKKKVKPVAYFAGNSTYKKRFRFYERGLSTAKASVVKNFKTALAKAIRTAK